jgi:Flp pilus assembly protein TadD
MDLRAPMGESGNTAPREPRGRRTDLAIRLVLALAVLAVYGQAVRFGFIPADDEGYVYGNPVVRHGLTLDGVRFAFTSLLAANWHPLAWLSHMADVSLFGLRPGGHHAVNALLHGACALLLFGTLRALTGARWRSAFVAAAFAVHPLNVETVAWVCERKSILSALFFFLAIRAWGSYGRTGSRRAYGAALAAHAAALMAKPMAVTTPFVLLLLDAWPLGRLRPPSADGEAEGSPAAKADDPDPALAVTAPPVAEGAAPGSAAGGRTGGAPLRLLLLEKVPFLLLTAASCVVTVVAQSRGEAIGSIPLPFRLANAARSVLLYAADVLFPTGLSFFYPFPARGIPAGEAAGGALLVVAVTAAAVRWRRTLPWLAVGWFWFLGTLVPVIGLVQVGRQAMADRYMYIPSIGLFLVAAWGAASLSERFAPKRGRALLPALAAAALVALSAAAWRQAGYWKDEPTLLSRAIALDPDNAFAHQNLSIVLAERGDLAGSLREQEEAFRIEPGNPRYAVNLAVAALRVGRTAEAEQLLREVVAVEPGHALAHAELGRLAGLRKDWGEAERELREALRLQPWNGRFRRYLGDALSRAGKDGEGIAELREALRPDPENAPARRDLGGALSRAGFPQEGIVHLREAVRLAPEDPEAWHMLGAALDLVGRYDEAIPAYGKAVSLNPAAVAPRIRLAFDLSRTGRGKEAERLLSDLLAVLPGDGRVEAALAAVRGGGPLPGDGERRAP